MLRQVRVPCSDKGTYGADAGHSGLKEYMCRVVRGLDREECVPSASANSSFKSYDDFRRCMYDYLNAESFAC